MNRGGVLGLWTEELWELEVLRRYTTNVVTIKLFMMFLTCHSKTQAGNWLFRWIKWNYVIFIRFSRFQNSARDFIYLASLQLRQDLNFRNRDRVSALCYVPAGLKRCYSIEKIVIEKLFATRNVEFFCLITQIRFSLLWMVDVFILKVKLRETFQRQETESKINNNSITTILRAHWMSHPEDRLPKFCKYSNTNLTFQYKINKI